MKEVPVSKKNKNWLRILSGITEKELEAVRGKSNVQMKFEKDATKISNAED